MKLTKELSFMDIFAIASGTMISSGIFILPGLAFSETGPSVFVSYFLAGILALFGTLSIVELATAMPKAGGDYYFVTRSLGPLIGTISGFLSWFALSLKSAFAIFGIAEILHILLNFNVITLAIIVCCIFVVINIIGVKVAGKLEVILVFGLLAIMLVFIIFGIGNVKISKFEPFSKSGFIGILQTTGFVFVSFGGLLKVASISEEVKNPKKNIPKGLIASVLTISFIYAIMLIVTVGVSNPNVLSKSLTPIADAAKTFFGNFGFVILSIGATLAFVTTAIAGIMSASRYPMALSRDNLLPPFISKVNKKFKTPVISTIITGGFIIIALFLELKVLVKAASTIILTTYVLANVSVIILRESKIQNYKPSFKSPFYPYLHIVGVIVFIVLIIDMGINAIEISISGIVLGIIIYFAYGRRKSQKEYALLHVLERVLNKELRESSGNLENELRDVLHQRDEVIQDKVDALIKSSIILDIEKNMNAKDFFKIISKEIADEINLDVKNVLSLLNKRERESSTAITSFVAIPHIIVKGKDIFKIAIARAKDGINFSKDHENVQAVFVLIGSKDNRNLHLKVLSAIAQMIQSKNFEKDWLNAKKKSNLIDILLLSDRKRYT